MSSKYAVENSRDIIKTTKLYSDGKTQVPKQVIVQLKLKKGSQIVWIQNGDKINITSSKI